jgi:RNA polymerase sigma factor (sigma-70 family)
VRDNEELHAAISGNAADWQRLAFLEYHGLVHGLVLKCLGPNAEAADLVSEVFVKFFENAHRIRVQGAIRSYLVSITMNAIRGEVRRRKRRDLLMKLSGLLPELEQEPGHDDPKAKAALIQLSRILEELGANDRIAFVLHSLEGMHIAEIAGVLRVSESTAKRRVRRANEHVLKRVSRNALLADYIQDKRGRNG